MCVLFLKLDHPKQTVAAPFRQVLSVLAFSSSGRDAFLVWYPPYFSGSARSVVEKFALAGSLFCFIFSFFPCSSVSLPADLMNAGCYVICKRAGCSLSPFQETIEAFSSSFISVIAGPSGPHKSFSSPGQLAAPF